MNYEEQIAQLTDTQKKELWSKVKDFSFSPKTKYSIIYYEAVSRGYLIPKAKVEINK